jgi:hypothetical protein
VKEKIIHELPKVPGDLVNWKRVCRGTRVSTASMQINERHAPPASPSLLTFCMLMPNTALESYRTSVVELPSTLRS